MNLEKRLETLFENLSKEFDLDKISKSPARFNQQKLDWFNKNYLKMMSLEEFAYRTSRWNMKYGFLKKENDLEINLQEKEKQNTDYLFLIDASGKEIFTLNLDSDSNFEESFYLLGGGRKEQMTAVESLKEAIKEQTKSQLVLDLHKVKKFAEFKTVLAKEEKQVITNFKIYFYQIEKKDLHNLEIKRNKRVLPFAWQSLDKHLQSRAKDCFLNYAIIREFFLTNNLKVPNPSKEILNWYLALSLDKDRITTLSELGLESKCIFNYQPPAEEDLKWKKISLAESKSNLQEIWKALKDIFYTRHSKLEKKFIERILQNQLTKTTDEEIKNEIVNLEFILSEIVSLWESEIKLWLKDNQKSVGDYLWPLRVALSGKKRSASPFELLAVLDKSEAERRIKACL